MELRKREWKDGRGKTARTFTLTMFTVITRVQPSTYEKKERTICERRAVFPKKIVRLHLEVGPKGCEHLSFGGEGDTAVRNLVVTSRKHVGMASSFCLASLHMIRVVGELKPTCRKLEFAQKPCRETHVVRPNTNLLHRTEHTRCPIATETNRKATEESSMLRTTFDNPNVFIAAQQKHGWPSHLR